MRLLSIALTMLAFSSCASYQYLTLDSSEVQKNDKKEFTWENDTMRLIYNFHGEGGPISMSIYNKLSKPLLVNWKKSSFVRDGQAFSLLDHNVQLSGGYSGSSTGTIAASFDLPEGMNLVPPGSFITKSLNALVQPAPVYSAKFTEKTEERKVTNPMGGGYSYKRFLFDPTASPLQFKSYLAFALANSTEEFFVSHSFYAQEVLLSSEVPEYFTPYKQQGDQLYVRQPAQ